MSVWKEDRNDHTKLKTLHGVDIFVDTNGKFSAKVGRQTLTRASLQALEREISKTVGGVDVIYFVRDYEPTYAQVVGHEKDTRGWGSGKFRLKDRTLVATMLYRFDAKVFEQLVALHATQKEAEARHKELLSTFRKRREELVEGLTRLRVEDLHAQPEEKSEESKT